MDEDPVPERGRGNRYISHGLSISSSFELPEFSSSGAGAHTDIEISIEEGVADIAASVLGPCPENVIEPVCATAPDGAAIFRTQAGDFWVRDGAEIRVAPVPDADPGMVQLFTLGSAIGLALLQRGALVLHGASAVVGGQAVVLLGHRGAGKSTLAAGLGDAGVAMLGDDVAALWPGSGEAFEIAPSGVAFKLWHGALEALGQAADGLRPVANRAEKYYLPAPSHAGDSRFPVRHIVVLDRDDALTSARIEKVDKLEALQCISANLYRPGFVETLGLQSAHFQATCTLLGAADVWRLSRPWGHEKAPATIRLLRRHLGDNTDVTDA